MFMSRINSLSTNIFPSLRYSLFCGEALPISVVKEWQKSAPGSIVDNLYGPTEATIAFMEYRLVSDDFASESINGTVLIGKPFKGSLVKIIDDNDTGEMCLSGDQVVNGYFKNKKLTQEKFITFPSDQKRVWYRTGDLVKKLDDGNYAFIGRVDEQMQIRGNRVEMSEIDKVVREAVGHQMAISIPLVAKDNIDIAEDIVAFVEGNDKIKTEESLIESCKKYLPDYMVPSNIYFIDKMPLNQNGKIDKNELSGRLTENKFGSFIDSDKNNKCCNICLKDIVNHNGKDDYICHVCLRGF
jgi:acyl-CoA synthetase (AMP-forming)/AMP-acid ligase II